MPISKLRAYMKAYNIRAPNTAVEKDDLVEAVLKSKVTYIYALGFRFTDPYIFSREVMVVYIPFMRYFPAMINFPSGEYLIAIRITTEGILYLRERPIVLVQRTFFREPLVMQILPPNLRIHLDRLVVIKHDNPILRRPRQDPLTFIAQLQAQTQTQTQTNSVHSLLARVQTKTTILVLIPKHHRVEFIIITLIARKGTDTLPCPIRI